ncbi:MAG: hypothetical protein BGO43_15250 [Gammaproteobacteria bacterium 39-13]|nr:CPBP family intramembrane metalloprotease [Gammaproteobacteria bacterium]OJV87774.1 MAG: hypothetical protein BGO43_15250 [Gammaproteobacteria bacterium 39-13]
MKKQFAILWVLCLIGTVAVLPLIQALANTQLQTKFYIYSLLQATVLYAFVIYVGLKLTLSIKFEVGNLQLIKKEIFHDLVIAIILAFTIYILDKYVFKLHEFITFPNPPLWQKIVASLYGAINEEVLMRMFLVSLLIKVFYMLFKPISSKNFFICLSIVLSAIAFGAGHLPAMAKISELTPLAISRTFILNGLGGIVFGWLYWRKSLANAMVAHGCTDIILAFLP